MSIPFSLCTVEAAGRPVACMERDGRYFRLPKDLMTLLAEGTALEELAAGDEVKAARVLTPLQYPGKVLCAGANYYDHIKEMGVPDLRKEAQRLFFFFKPPRNAVVGPGATVTMPRGTKKYDWEIELAAVIGKTARYVSVENALSHIAGYTVAIDLSARDFNQAPDQFYKFDWVAGKATDTACPMGPWIVPAEALGDVQSVALKLSVNGVVKQDSSTSQMIYSVAEQIARASELMTLDPGDVVLTGTPAGVGVPRGTFLSPGDKIDAEIAGIGKLSVEIKPPL